MLRQIMAAFGVIVVAGALSPAVGEDAPQKGLEIKVVKTFDDLYKQPEIALESRVKVHVGIGADGFRVGERMLVYCLTDETAVDHLAQDGENIVGPLGVFVVRKGEIEPKILARHDKYSRRPLEKGDYLFANPLTADKAGEYVVTLKEGVKVVAQITFKVELTRDDDAPPAWIMFCWPEVKQEQKQKQKLGDPIRLDVDYLRRGLPKWEGSLPRQVKGRDVDRTKEALPMLVPQKTDPGLKLTVEGEGDLFTIESDHPMTISGIEEHFLARWWVNGKPYVPAADETKPRIMDRTGLWQEKTKVQLKLDFDPINLGARKGDKIAVQILYCDDGVEAVTRSLMDEAMDMRKPMDSREQVRMSNKVEFVAP